MEKFTTTRGAERQNGVLLKWLISAISERQKVTAFFPLFSLIRHVLKALVESWKGDGLLLKPGLKDDFMPVAL